ncbi:MAG: hypothetical protein SchgKO_23310 [Schleiferiaceae bacterium]
MKHLTPTLCVCLFLVLSLSACNAPEEKTEAVLEVTEGTPSAEEITSENQENSNNTQDYECIFDMETQTDEFIQGVEALKNYRWDDQEKVAYVTLPDSAELIIHRGGCDHFDYSLHLKDPQDTVSFKNTEYWTGRIAEYVRMLPDFDQDAFEQFTADLGEPETSTERFMFWGSNIGEYTGGIELVISKEDEGHSVIFGYGIN